MIRVLLHDAVGPVGVGSFTLLVPGPSVGPPEVELSPCLVEAVDGLMRQGQAQRGHVQVLRNGRGVVGVVHHAERYH